MRIGYFMFARHARDPAWTAEPCMSDYRCLAHRHHNRIDLWNQYHMRIEAPYTELRRQIKDMIPDRTILDGVLFGEGKIRDHYYTFDIPEFQGEPAGVLYQRHALLKYIYHDQPLIQVSEHYDNAYKIWSEITSMPKVNTIM